MNENYPVQPMNVGVSKYQLVVFDFDGTLADTLLWMRGIFNELAVEHGFRRVEAHEQERFRDLHGTALLRELGLPLWKLPRVMNAMRKRMAEHTGAFTLFPGMRDVLRQLDESGVQLAVVSCNSIENVKRVLGQENARFAHFACGISMFGKAAKLRAVVRRSGVSLRQAIYIGDEVRDAEAAAKAGMDFGAVTWGQQSAKALRGENPTEIFATVGDLTALCVSDCQKA